MSKTTIYTLLLSIIFYAGCAIIDKDNEIKDAELYLEEGIDDEIPGEPVELEELEELEMNEDEDELISFDEDYPDEEVQEEPKKAQSSKGHMAVLKRDCHIRQRPDGNSKSLIVVKSVGRKIWVRSHGAKFYKVSRGRDITAYMWKGCFK